MAVAFLLAALDVCETGAQVAVLGAGSARERCSRRTASPSSGTWSARRASTPRFATSSPRHGARANIDPGVWDRLVIAVAPGPVMDADGRTPGVGLHDKILDAAGVAALLSKPMT